MPFLPNKIPKPDLKFPRRWLGQRLSALLKPSRSKLYTQCVALMVGTAMFVVGVYFGLAHYLLPAVKALSESTHQMPGNTAFNRGETGGLAGYDDGGGAVIATGAEVTLNKVEDWWQVEYQYKKPLTVTNLANEPTPTPQEGEPDQPAVLAAGTTVRVTVDTQKLAAEGKLQEDCDDLRVVYRPQETVHQELNRSLQLSSGAANCAESAATIIAFPLQGALTQGESADGYALYYGHETAQSPGLTAQGYDIARADGSTVAATLVCPFNGTTTCLTQTGTANPTAATGAIRYSGGKGAMSFDGNNDLIRAGNDPGVNNLARGPLTVELWIKPTQKIDSGYHYIIGKSDTGVPSNGWYFFTYNTRLTGVVQAQSLATSHSNSTLTVGQWQHIAMTYDDTGDRKIRLYINGVETSYSNQTTASGTVIDDSAKILCIGTVNGGCSSSSYNVFPALYDEIRISNTVRYTANFTPQTTPFEPDEHTKLLLHFDENGDDPRFTGKAIDASGNGNHGTINGAKYVGGLIGVDASANDTGHLPNQAYAAHGGVFIEEGTTNLVTNPSFEHGVYNTNWGLNYFNHNSALSSFTPAVAKRNAPGPFTAAPIIQGDWATENGKSDTLTFNQEDQISGNFYPNFDSSQGSMVMWVTPEWQGNDNVTHYLFQGSNNFKLYKNTDNALVFSAAPGISVSKDISSWAAGATYNLIVRWDSQNSLDNTNHLSITIDDGPATLGQTSTYTPEAPASTLYIGSTSSGTNPANAIIEGLTIYRRPLFDGSSGINAGNGDEINLTAGATDQDPTLLTGSWDVVFDLPTNSSTGSLGVGGTGQAWTHPHSSNVLYTSTTNTGGFMMNGAYTADGWTDEGTPTTVAALSTGEKIYGGGYKITTDAVNEGIKYTLSGLAAGKDYVVRAVANSGDGVGQPKIFIYDETNGHDITSLAGTVGSGRTAPDVLLFTFELPTVARYGDQPGYEWVAADCTSISVKLVNAAASGAVYWHQIEVLENSIDNPSMETGTGDPWIPNGWTNNTLDEGDSSQGTFVHSGSASWQRNSGAIAGETISQSLGSAGTFNSFGAFSYAATGQPNPNLYPALGLPYNQYNNSYYNYTNTTKDAWTWKGGVWRGAGDVRLSTAGTGTTYFDDFYFFRLTAVPLTVTPASQTNSTEATGLRVDGADSLTQPITGLSAAGGIIKFRFTPRHSFGVADKFGSTNPVVAHFYQDGQNYLKLYRHNASTLRLTGVFNGLTLNADWTNPVLNANTTYAVQISYLAGGRLSLLVNGVEAFTEGVAPFAAPPATAYFGTDNGGAGSNPYDATYTNFEALTPSENTAGVYTKFGGKSAKLVNASASPDEYTIAINPNSGATHTLSAYVYDATAGNIGGAVSASVAKLVFANQAVTPSSYTDMGGGWWRLAYAGAMPPDANYLSANIDADQGLYASESNKQLAQSFKVSENMAVNSVNLYLKKIGSGTPTTTHYRVAIQTDNGGLPSGTVVANSNCVARTSSAAYAAVGFSFSSPPNLTAGTTYHLALTPYTNSACSALQTNANAGDYLAWGYDNTSSGYPDGYKSTYDGSSWTAQAGNDHSFEVYGGKTLNYGVQAQAGKTIYVDGVQLEQKAYSTTYADGSLGVGYTWVGTANESGSTRSGSSGGYLRYSSTDRISSSQGSISLWIKRIQTNTGDKGWSFNEGYFKTSTTNQIEDSITLTGYSGTLYCGYGTVYGRSLGTTTINSWYHVIISWQDNTRYCYFNNVDKGSFSRPSLLTDTIDIGRSFNWGAIYPSDAIISDFRTFDKALTAEEVADLYYQGLATHTSGNEAVDRYQEEGTYTSPVIDLSANGGWGAIPLTLNDNADPATNGAVSYFTRTRGTLDAWSGWQAVTPLSGDDYTIASPPRRYFQWKAELTSNQNRSQAPVISGMSVHYIEDTTPPDNPDITALGYSTSQEKEANLTSGSWYHHPQPKFSWSAGEDPEPLDQSQSGLHGYHVLLTKTENALPAEHSGDNCYAYINDAEEDGGEFMVGISAPNCQLSDGIYYLYTQTRDNAGNDNPAAALLFTYQYDATIPGVPVSISSTTIGYSATNSFDFYWPPATDEGGAGIAYYEYKTGSTDPNDPFSQWQKTSGPDDRMATGVAAYTEGQNLFFVRSVDRAGNYSAPTSNIAALPFYYNQSAPTAPTKVTITPATSADKPATSNVFSVAWEKPASYNGEIAKYYYCVNCTPSASTMTETTSAETVNRALTNAALATQQGKNTFYLVAEDNNLNVETGHGNRNFDAYAAVDFYATTTAPDAPTNLSISDTSNRDQKIWRLTLVWNEAKKESGVNRYDVYRSADKGVTYGKIGTVSSGAYTDTNLEYEKTYYYKVKAIDNAGSESLFSNVVYESPLGRYADPPAAGGVPVVNAGSTTAVVSWQTSRAAYGTVEYGKTTAYGAAVSSTTQTSSHVIKLTGLAPGTAYHFRVHSLDESNLVGYDRAKAYSDDFTFTTLSQANIANVEVTDVGLDFAVIQWTTASLASSQVSYGTTTEYGKTVTVSTTPDESTHTARLAGLEHSTKYHFRIAGITADSTDIFSEDYTFETIIFPRFTALLLSTDQSAAGATVVLAWSTNVPTSGTIQYQPAEVDLEALKGSRWEEKLLVNTPEGLALNATALQALPPEELILLPVIPSGETETRYQGELNTRHIQKITGLKDGSIYIITVRGVDEHGNEAISDPLRYVTGADTRPPQINNLIIETPISGTGASARASIIISWETDEPSYGQVHWGIGPGSEFPNSTEKSGEAVSKHVMVLRDLLPTQTYHLKAEATDQAGNLSATDDIVVVTPNAQQAAFDIVLENLEEIFGFLRW